MMRPVSSNAAFTHHQLFMKRRLIVAVGMFLMPILMLEAQVENRPESQRPDVPEFYVDAMAFQSNDSLTTRVDIYIQVPHEALRFVSSDSEFVARYEITVNFLGEEGNAVMEKIWNEETHLRTFEQTQAKNGYSLTQRSISLPPGSYVMRTQLREMESRKVSTQIRKITVPVYKDIRFGMSDIMLVNHVTNASGHTTIVPNVSGNLYNVPDGFFLFFEVYNTTKADSLELTYTITDKREKQIYTQIVHRRLEGKRTQMISKVDSSRYPVGLYQLEVNARTLPNERDSVSYAIQKKRGFVMRWGNTPLTIVDLDLAVRQTRYISSDKEFDTMNDAPTIDEKQRLFQEFWRKRDPSPDTQRNEYMEEYYSRVQYSNEHFSHYIDGWRTDMGMVFIILGSPNNVDRHPFDYDSKPYEIWSYYEYDRQAVFVDETGFGDYRLVSPIWDLLRRTK